MKGHIRYIMSISAICILGIFLIACSRNKKPAENKSESKETLQSVADASKQQNKIPKGKEIVTDYTKFVQPQEDQEYNFETDFQFYMTPTFGSTKIKNGYTFSDGSFIYLFDPETGIYDYMCGKPDCKHEISDCNAYVPNFFEVEYYKGNFYTAFESRFLEAGDEDVTKYSIIKASQDCTTKDKVREIAKVLKENTNEGEAPYITYIQHRGYFYYAYSIGEGTEEENYHNNGSNCLYRVSLESSEKEECILPLSFGTSIPIMNMTAEGSYIYFVMSDEGGFGKLYRYNTESDMVEQMDIGEIASETYTILNGKIIYKKNYNDKILYSYHPMNNTEEVFCDMTDLDSGDSWNIGHDTNYVYVYYTNVDTKEAYVLFLDYKGNYIGKAVVNQDYKKGSYVGDFMGGDEYLMYRPSNTKKFMYLKKEDIINGTAYLKEAKDEVLKAEKEN